MLFHSVHTVQTVTFRSHSTDRYIPSQPCARAAYVVPALHTLAARARRLESIGYKEGRGASERGRLEQRDWHLEGGAHLMREAIKAYERS